MRRWGWGLLGATLVACAARPPVAAGPGRKSCEAIREYLFGDLAAYGERLDESSRRYQDEQWKVETADAEASAERVAKLFAAYQQAAYDRGILADVRALDAATAHLSPDACRWRQPLARVRRLLDTLILADPAVIAKEKENQRLQDDLIAKSNAYRISLPGEAEPVSRAIYAKRLGRTADRAERERLYHRFQASRAQQWTAWGFRDLVKARNEEARLAGYRNYYEYRFFRNELDYGDYRARVAEIRRDIAPKVRALLARLGREAGIRRLAPWDLRYVRERHASGALDDLLAELPAEKVVAVAERFYRQIGIDVPSYSFRMDLYPRPGKNTHAFAMLVVYPHVDLAGNLKSEPAPDIRFLANLKQPVQWSDVTTVIHELGHAVHGAEVRQPVPVLVGVGSVATEAAAMFLERLANGADFLETALPAMVQKAPAAAALRTLLRSHERAARAEQAFVLLRQVFFSEVEEAIYAQPDADYAVLYAQLHEAYWGVPVVPSEADWDVEHFLMAPVYVQNYAIGILMVEQFYAAVREEAGDRYLTPALGDKLRKSLFAPGDELSYLGLTERFSGAPLGTSAAVRLLDGN